MKKEREILPRKISKPSILHQDASITVVNKPASVWAREGVFDDAGVFDTLAPGVEPDDVSFVQVNPLEFEVSGLVLYAANETAASALRDQFKAGRARMTFVCVVQGPLLAESGVLSNGAQPAGEKAADPRSTQWRTIDAFVGFNVIECETSSLAESHVRRDLQHAGMPLAVDDRFGGASELMLSSFKAGYRRSRRRPERALIERPSLHLAKMTIQHPDNGQDVSFDAEPPKDFRAVLNQLDRFGRIPK